MRYTGWVDATTIDGIKPFMVSGDLSTPNPAYFARADTIIGLAARAGMVVFLDPIETGGWLGVLRDNGVAKAYAYGRFLARRYKRFSNIVWAHRNDFQSWSNSSDDAVVLAVARGIRSLDPAQMQTVELDTPESVSLDDRRWRAAINLDAVYTHVPTYVSVLKESTARTSCRSSWWRPATNSSRTRLLTQPVLLMSCGGRSPGVSCRARPGSSTAIITAGSSPPVGSSISTPPAALQMRYLVKLFASRRWFELVPDQARTIVTAGYGRFVTSGNVESSRYVTTAATPDRTLAVSYLPGGGTITVAMARFAGPVTARWYDPTNGTYSDVSGSPFPNTGSVDLTPPKTNTAGDRDWVLILTTH